VRDYAHSTAPNRRYPDLITQRLLKAALAKRPVPYSADELQALAQHCTQKEDDAAKVERQMNKSAAAMLPSSRIGERFDAIVTGESNRMAFSFSRTGTNPPMSAVITGRTAPVTT
jgi:exoribonuclease-2